MPRIRFRKLILFCTAVALYTRVAVYYFQSDDAEEESVTESRPNMIAREVRPNGVKTDQHMDRNILGTSDLYEKRKNDIAVQGRSAFLGIKEMSGDDKTELAVPNRNQFMEAAKQNFQTGTSNLRQESSILFSTVFESPNRKVGKTIRQRLKGGIDYRPVTKPPDTTLMRKVKTKGAKKQGDVMRGKGRVNVVRKLGTAARDVTGDTTTINYAKATKITTRATGRINVYTYNDVFPSHDNTNLFWNPLFPKLPYRSYFANRLEDRDWVRTTVTRRFLGYIQVNKTGVYSFKVETKMGIDLLIFERFISNKTVILRFTIANDELLKFDFSNEKLYQAESTGVWLDEGRRYPIDLIHGLLHLGRFSLKLKLRGDSSYRVVDADYISPLYENSSLNVILPDSFAYTGSVPALRRRFNEDKRLVFGSRIQLNSKSCRTGLKNCLYSPSYLFRGNKVRLYYGQGYVRRDLIFPYDHTNYHEEPSKHRKFLNDSIAKGIATSVFNSISIENEGIYKLQNIVHVEENHEKRRYFVELDILNTIDGKSYRFSDYFLKTSHNDKLCLPQGYANKWRHNVTVYLVCAVKNQRQWFQYLIQSIEELIERTNDHNLHLIAVDFHSTDADLKSYLQRSKLNYTLLQMEGNFSKVKGLNEGVRQIPRNDSIIFVMDLQLKIPDHLFDQARKHTIQGITAYCPILIRLGPVENPEFTKLTDHSIWQDIGYGMMSIFKSDWDRIGGMNEKMFQYKWGGEDWEFVDRVMVGQLELIHQRLPGFYHIHHSTKGTWDGTKLF